MQITGTPDEIAEFMNLLKSATTEQKEKAYIAATAFLLGAQQKTA